MDKGSTLGVVHGKYWNHNCPRPCLKSKVSMLGLVSQDDLRLPPPPAPKAGNREVCLSLPSTLEFRDFAQGEAGHITKRSEGLPKGADFICNRMWESSN